MLITLISNYTVFEKGATNFLALNFAEHWQIFKILSPTDLAVNI